MNYSLQAINKNKKETFFVLSIFHKNLSSASNRFSNSTPFKKIEVESLNNASLLDFQNWVDINSKASFSNYRVKKTLKDMNESAKTFSSSYSFQ